MFVVRYQNTVQSSEIPKRNNLTNTPLQEKNGQPKIIVQKF